MCRLHGRPLDVAEFERLAKEDEFSRFLLLADLKSIPEEKVRPPALLHLFILFFPFEIASSLIWTQRHTLIIMSTVQLFHLTVHFKNPFLREVTSFFFRQRMLEARMEQCGW